MYMTFCTGVMLSLINKYMIPRATRDARKQRDLRALLRHSDEET
jgi:hypothetical protein